ncbi:MAG: WbqC family protein [Bryobacteraceae bacterium]
MPFSGENVSASPAKRVAISQSNYIPWKGYFDLINSVDEFILFDDMQYTRRDWRNRNKIKVPQGTTWLTIPVEVKGKYFQKIRDTVVSDPDWSRNHWKTIQTFYVNALHFGDYKHLFENLYLGCEEKSLSLINHRFLTAICRELGICTKLTWSMQYSMAEGKTERLVSLCKQAHAGVYISGPSARDYIRPELFHQEGIELVYFDYAGYPEYRQLYPPFEHAVSVVDLLLNEGPEAAKYMRSF